MTSVAPTYKLACALVEKMAEPARLAPGSAVAVNAFTHDDGKLRLHDAGRLLNYTADPSGKGHAVYHSTRTKDLLTAPEEHVAPLVESDGADEARAPRLGIVPLDIADAAHAGRSLVYLLGEQIGSLEPSSVAGTPMFTLSLPPLGVEEHYLDRQAALDALHRLLLPGSASAQETDAQKALTLGDLFKFEESEHPRADDGKFGSGGGGAKAPKKAPKPKISTVQPRIACSRCHGHGTVSEGMQRSNSDNTCYGCGGAGFVLGASEKQEAATAARQAKTEAERAAKNEKTWEQRNARLAEFAAEEPELAMALDEFKGDSASYTRLAVADGKVRGFSNAEFVERYIRTHNKDGTWKALTLGDLFKFEESEHPRADDGTFVSGGGANPAEDTPTAAPASDDDAKHPFAQTNDFEAFRAMLALSPLQQFLSKHTDEQYAKGRCFRDDTGKCGMFIDVDGDMCNLVNMSGVKGRGLAALRKAIRLGGKTLDCYDPDLPELYKECGMVETARMKFNRDYMPDGWDVEKDDDPDIVFMAHGVSEGPTLYFEGQDWDKAKAHARTTWNDAHRGNRNEAQSGDEQGGLQGPTRKTVYGPGGTHRRWGRTPRDCCETRSHEGGTGSRRLSDLFPPPLTLGDLFKDAAFEDQHPRADDGKFGSGGGDAKSAQRPARSGESSTIARQFQQAKDAAAAHAPACNELQATLGDLFGAERVTGRVKSAKSIVENMRTYGTGLPSVSVSREATLRGSITEGMKRSHDA